VGDKRARNVRWLFSWWWNANGCYCLLIRDAV